MWNINKTLPHESEWTRPLQNIAKPPSVLRYLGALPSERTPTVAIVGARKPTAYGEEMTLKFAFELAKCGIIIVSGLALGIDALAHKGALDAGGITIAVLGNGLPTIYPSRHQSLARRILDNGGAILSEYPENSPAWPSNFLERNRIVSGLSDAVLVIEAAERSGTLSTAAHALEQGRTIFALPGHITSPLSTGCNNLLKQGATPATSVDDILHALKIMPEQSAKSLNTKSRPTTDPESLIFAKLEEGLTDGDEIMKSLSLPASDFAVAITMLEIGDFVVSLGANRWSIK
ncbi:DNA-processing protein DprA [Candidatus Saccharibacteria bacterium]|nr:DNA-processing protein DprA [Candidatus Saccharibacteria bacterium]